MAEPRTAPSRPPAWLYAAVLTALAALLFYPVHVPYQNPDQDLPLQQSLVEHVRGGWAPISLAYPSGLNTVLRAGYEIALFAANGWGLSLDEIDLLVALQREPERFRVAVRLLAMAAGLAALAATCATATAVGDRWGGIFAALLLGTSSAFVRENHYGMQDPLSAGASTVCLLLCTMYLQTGSTRSIVAAAATAGLAFCFKQNGALTGVPLLAAIALSQGGWRERAGRLFLAGAVGLAVVLVMSPAVLLEWHRFLRHQQLIQAVVYEAGARYASGPSYDLTEVLRNGVGAAIPALAVAGAIRAAVAREKALVPTIGFLLAHVAVDSRSMVVLSRYALPMLPPLAILASYALAPSLPLVLRAAVTLGVVAVRAPAAIAFVTLIASEDTRVSAARWLDANVSPDARVFLPGGPLYIGYVGPTLRPKAAPDRSLAPELKAEIERRTPESFPRVWRFARALARGEDGERIPSRFAGSIIVTAEHGAPVFDVAMTSPAFIRMLERNARLLADFPIEREPGPRVYEPRDLNFSPVAGADTLLRPGPRIRIWSVPNGEARPG